MACAQQWNIAVALQGQFHGGVVRGRNDGYYYIPKRSARCRHGKTYASERTGLKNSQRLVVIRNTVRGKPRNRREALYLQHNCRALKPNDNL